MKFNKDTVKKFFNFFFVTLGVVFFILIVVLIYIYFADPLGLRANNSGEVLREDSILSVNQEETLRALGIDPNSIPSEFTAEQEACFVEKLGQERVDEIKGGVSPNSTDLFKAKDCL